MKLKIVAASDLGPSIPNLGPRDMVEISEVGGCRNVWIVRMLDRDDTTAWQHSVAQRALAVIRRTSEHATSEHSDLIADLVALVASLDE